MVDAGPHVMRHLADYRLTTFMQLTNTSVAVSPAESVAVCAQMSQHFLVTKTNCQEAAYFCRYIGVGVNISGVTFVIYNRARRLFWINSGGDPVEWALDVKRGKVPAKGPGDGLFSSILNPYYEHRGHDRPLIVFIIGPLIVLVSLAFVLMDITGLMGGAKETPKEKAD
jgi:hypothetical protein